MINLQLKNCFLEGQISKKLKFVIKFFYSIDKTT